METLRSEYILNPASVDEISGLITEFCVSSKTGRKDMLRYRLSAEECLLHWLENGDEGNKVTVSLGQRMLVPFICIEEKGKASNPYTDKSEEYGSFADSILVSLNLNPEYSYEKGANVVRYRLKRKSPGQIAKLCIIIAAAVIIGLIGMAVLPQGARDAALEGLVVLLYETFFRILSCVAGPMIFMSVAWGIYGMGDAATLGRVGKSMMLRFVGATLIVAALSVGFYPLLGPKFTGGSGQSAEFASITELILGIFPSNVVEPFQTGNTLQIIFMSFVTGVALLFLGHQTSSVARAIEQLNALVQFLMEIISRLVPYVIFLVIINMIWSGAIASMGNVWKFLVALTAGLVLISVIMLVYTSVKMQVSIHLLVSKSIPTFLIALTTASSVASFGTMTESCEKGFGIEKSLTKFGVPLGMVMCKPASALNFLLLAFYFASEYEVECSVGWIIIAFFVSSMLAIAAPPIPGGAAVAYSMLYMQMGIPQEALAVTLAMDAFIDFIVTPVSMIAIQFMLIITASKLGMIDREAIAHDVQK